MSIMDPRLALHLPLTIHCDAILVVQGERFNAHRAVLAANSPVFHRMLNSYAENQEVVLNNISAAAFHRVLEFLYTGQLRVCCPHSAVVLLVPAQRLLIEPLLDRLEEWLIRNVQLPDYCELFMIADLRGLPSLKQSFRERIASQLDVISMDASFPRLNIRLVEELLQASADLERYRHDITYEVEAVTAIVRWLAQRGGYAAIEGVEKCDECSKSDRHWVRTNQSDSSAGSGGRIWNENRMHYEERLLGYLDLRNASDQVLVQLVHIANTHRLDVLRKKVRDERKSRYQPQLW